MPPAPLSPQQQKAAALIGRGRSRQDVAGELGVSTKTLSRWNQREDFRALVRQHRAAVLDERPTARAALEAALTATTASGEPDHRIRVSAARALLGIDGPGDSADPEERATKIYVGLLDDEPGAATPEGEA